MFFRLVYCVKKFIKMEFVAKLNVVEENLSDIAKIWLENRKESLKKGFVNIQGNLRAIIEEDEPFFVLFDEFHLKKVNNAPSNIQSWKIFSIAVSSFNGPLQIVYLRTASSGIEKMGSAAILEGVKMVLGCIRKSPEAATKLAGAVADKCAANLEAIHYLNQNGVPVLYALRHFCGTMRRFGFVDLFNTSLFTIPTYTKGNYNEYLLESKRLVEENVPPELQDRYTEERLALQSLFGNLFNTFPNRTFKLSMLNSNHLEEVGAKLGYDVHAGAEEGFGKYPAALADPKEAVAFMAFWILNWRR